MCISLRRFVVAVVVASSLVAVAMSSDVVGAAPFTYSTVSTGYHRTCAVTSDGLGLCWGWNRASSLGTQDRSANVLSPSLVSLPAGERFIHIEAGSYFTSCGLTASGSVYCWGENFAPSRFPIPDGVIVSQLSVGATQVCALSTDHDLYCHGDWNSGELGIGDVEYTHLPVRVTLPSGVTPVQVSAGIGFTCLVTTTGSAYCSGLNSAGQLGNGTITSSKVYVPVAMPTTTSVRSISAGLERACAVDTTGGGWCWGQNYSGALGDGSYAHSRIPRPVALDLGTELVDLQTGWYHTCGVTTHGSTLCWGSNDKGALGWGQSYGGKAIRTVALPDGVSARQLDLGLAGTCITATDSRIFCWGSNLRGSVGNGSTVPAYSPSQVLAVGTPDPAPIDPSSIGTHSVSLVGSVVPNGAATSVSIRIAPLSDLGEVRSISISIPPSRQSNLAQLFAPVSFSATIGGLRPATTYAATVHATNTFGSNDASAVAFTTLGGAPTIGTTTVRDIEGDSATIQTDVDSHLLETTVTATYSTDPTFASNVTTASLGVMSGNSNGELSVSLTLLDPRTTYWARITASNEVDTVTGEAFTFTTVGAPPSDLTVTTTGGRRSANVSVTLDTGRLPTAVSVSYRASDSGHSWESLTQTVPREATSATFDLSRLEPATSYDLQVTASNAAGATDHAQISFVTEGGAPGATNAEARDVSDTSATIQTFLDSNEFTTRVTLQLDSTDAFSDYDEWFAGAINGGSSATISLDVSELADSMTYFARFVAVNAKGTTIGETITFTTTTPVGKLLKRRLDDSRATPVVESSPISSNPLVTVQALNKPANRVTKASTRLTTKKTKKFTKKRTTKRRIARKAVVAR